MTCRFTSSALIGFLCITMLVLSECRCPFFPDPYFRFYFRLLAPHQDDLAYRPELVLPRIREGLRAFVGMTAFEELSRQWVLEQGRVGELPFEVREVGSHWSRRVQVDVVAVNWTDHQILLSEAKWGIGAVGRSVIRELIETKTPKVLNDLPGEEEGWRVSRFTKPTERPAFTISPWKTGR